MTIIHDYFPARTRFTELRFPWFRVRLEIFPPSSQCEHPCDGLWCFGYSPGARSYQARIGRFAVAIQYPERAP